MTYEWQDKQNFFYLNDLYTRNKWHSLKAGLDTGLDSGLWTLDPGLWTLDFFLKKFNIKKFNINKKYQILI